MDLNLTPRIGTDEYTVYNIIRSVPPKKLAVGLARLVGSAMKSDSILVPSDCLNRGEQSAFPSSINKNSSNKRSLQDSENESGLHQKRARLSDDSAQRDGEESYTMSGGVFPADARLSNGLKSRLQELAGTFAGGGSWDIVPQKDLSASDSHATREATTIPLREGFKVPGLPASARCQDDTIMRRRSHARFVPAPVDRNKQYGTVENPVIIGTPLPVRFEDVRIKTESRESSPTPVARSAAIEQQRVSSLGRSTPGLVRRGRGTPSTEPLASPFSQVTPPSIVGQGLSHFPEVELHDSRSQHSRASPKDTPQDFRDFMKQDAQMLRSGQPRTSSDPTRSAAVVALLRGHQLDDANLSRLEHQNGQCNDRRMQRDRHEGVTFQPRRIPNVLVPVSPYVAQHPKPMKLDLPRNGKK